MNEALLHYLWKYKIFRHFNFKDVQGNTVEILNFGQHHANAGPDFSMAQIKTGGVILTGNIEIHVKSSDWIFHGHDEQTDYNSVILHVVYKHDLEIDALTRAGIPTLELEPYIEADTVVKYTTLGNPCEFIPCEQLFDSGKIPFLFAETVLIRKLDEKSIEIEAMLQQTKNNYEAVLFRKLAYSFGLKVNADIYQSIAENIDFKIIQKISQNPHQLESLLFGLGHLLQVETEANRIWKKEYEFLKTKFALPDITFPVKFLRLMPPSFPTVRLSQLAQLYHRHPSLFSKILMAKDTEGLKELFSSVKASAFWEDHFTFEKAAEEKSEKYLSDEFIEILILNAVLPVLYSYYKHTDPDKTEEVIERYRTLKPEKNSVVKQWKALGVVFNSAMETQAFLYHHKNYCTHKKCADCGIGYQLLKN